MPLSDEEAALQAVDTLHSLSNEQQVAHTRITEILHGGEENPFVDIHELFALYNVLYFRKLLLPRVEVSWSARLTLCAGICELIRDDQGKYSRIRLKLSEPLLRYRPRSDTINTLLHESIHAYFFITSSWRHSRGDPNDPEAASGHGIGFKLLADAINNHGDYEITIYHTFHDEVDSYRTHIWRCDGPCQTQAPFFGLVKRSMNRAPGKSDSWWRKHDEECGGTFTKIAEPEMTKVQLGKLSAKERAGRQKNKIDAWVKKGEASNKSTNPRQETSGILIKDAVVVTEQRGKGISSKRRLSDAVEVNIEPSSTKKMTLIACPICEAPVPEQEINEHLDIQHPF